jgi:hypothetical protein
MQNEIQKTNSVINTSTLNTSNLNNQPQQQQQKSQNQNQNGKKVSLVLIRIELDDLNDTDIDENKNFISDFKYYCKYNLLISDSEGFNALKNIKRSIFRPIS